jgi:hypothetical protein
MHMSVSVNDHFFPLWLVIVAAFKPFLYLSLDFPMSKDAGIASAYLTCRL